MRRVFVFAFAFLLIVCALSINVFGASGVPSTLPVSVWSSVDESNIVMRLESVYPAVNLTSFSNVLTAHAMPWRTMSNYSTAIGDNAAHLTMSMDTDYSGDSFAPRIMTLSIPFSVNYKQYGTIYFGAEFPTMYFTLPDGSTQSFSAVSAKVLYIDESGNATSKALISVKGTTSYYSREFYLNDFAGTITGIQFTFTFSSSFVSVDASVSVLIDAYLSAIYVEHAVGEDPILIPPQISIPSDITDIENDYHQSIDDLYSDVDMQKSDILSILGSISSDFHSPDIASAILWWGDLFTGLFNVGVVKTIFYVFAMVSVVSVILGLSLPSWIIDRKSSSESDSQSETVSEIETHKNGKVQTTVVVTRTKSSSSGNSKSHRRF